MKFLSRAVIALILVGVAIGFYRWMGDDQELFSTGWFETSISKFEQLREKGEEMGGNLPEVNPQDQKVTDFLPGVGEQQ